MRYIHPPRNRVAGLDGLRAIAILGIVFYHLMPLSVPGGFLGVTAFFTIMGYLMVITSSRQLADGTFHAGTYYKKKLVRLYPPLLTALALGLLFLLIIDPGYPKRVFPDVISILGGYNNWWQIAMNGSYFTRIANASPFTHLWYLGLTVQYYLLWPLILAIGVRLERRYRREQVNVFVMVLALISMVEMALLFNPAADPSRIYYGTDTRAYSLLLGIAIGMPDGRKIRREVGRHKGAAFALALGCLAVILVMYFTVEGTSAANYRGLMQLASILFAVLMILVVGLQSSLGRVLDVKPLQLIGRYSYEIYLVMYPVIFFVQHLTKNSYQPVWLILTLAIILGAAWLVHEISSRLTDRLDAGRAAIVLLAIVAALCGVQVGVHHVTAAKRADDQAKLERQLEESSKKLKKQQEEAQKAANVPNVAGSNVTAIGDSVMLGASGTMQQEIPGIYVDAAESRQVRDSTSVAANIAKAGNMRQTVIIHLGTNGAFSPQTGQSLVDAIGPGHTIYWVNAYGKELAWQGQVNSNIEAMAQSDPDIHVVDWAGYAANHPEWFYNDGIHLNKDGAKAYADFLKDQCHLQ